jgi:uncharacterized membrane protein YcaP (DUF421 family)
LIVLIGLAVVIQNATLQPGPLNALLFVATVFSTHRLLALACARWPALRHWVRGAPRVLVRNGALIGTALRQEGMSEEEVRAGLRKLGYGSEAAVGLAVLEETGQISAVARDGTRSIEPPPP